MRRLDCKAQAVPEIRARRRSPSVPHRATRALGLSVLLGLSGCGLPIITFQAEETAAGAVAEAAKRGDKASAALSDEPTVTGRIDKRPLGFGNDLGAEDWRRANAALAVALDPQGNGRPVKWDNPETTLRGSVNPTGLPYVANDLVCRDFLASVISPAGSRFVRGTGCKPSGGEWTLTKVRAARASS
jgi:surface antigen